MTATLSVSELYSTIIEGDLLDRVQIELDRQRALWGQQSHPLTSGNGWSSIKRSFYQGLANEAKDINARRVAGDCLSWDYILLEEVYEAFAELDEDKIVEELVQAAAVAIATAVSVLRCGPEGERG